MLIDVLWSEWVTIRRHPWTVLAILLSVAGVLHLALRHNELPKALAYLCAMLAAVFVVDLFAWLFPTNSVLPVRRPKRSDVRYRLRSDRHVGFDRSVQCV